MGMSGCEGAWSCASYLTHGLLLHGSQLDMQPCTVQSEEEVAAAVAEGNFFSLVAHQYWGVWALIQARHSPIDFDYFQYSKLRWSEYHRRKEEFMQAIQPHLERS